MINTARRKTLKMIAGSSVLAMSSTAYPLVSNANLGADSSGVDLTIQHIRDSGTARLLIRNTTDETVSIRFSADDVIHSPTGRYSLKQLASKGNLSIRPNDVKAFDLSNLDTSSIKLSDSHHALRFPIQNNVVIDHIAVGSNSFGTNKLAPVFLTQTIV